MTAPGYTATRSAARPRRRRLRRFVPPQHGAWAMLLVPWLAAVFTVGLRWPHLPLLGAWLTGYLLIYYLLQAVKTRRPVRVRAQLWTYSIPTGLLGGLVLLLRPELLWYAPAYATLLVVNIVYARRRAERALGNDIASVAQSCLMVFVCATAAGQPPDTVVTAFLAVAAYFTGTVLYVKTMIRERGNTTYYHASVGYHIASVALAAWLSLPLLCVFLLLLIRATVLPRRRLTPKHVGIVEILASTLVLLASTS
ncbi:YwiC-like family protein [Micromonospora sp. CA-263727]|uniref:YwiC-like family protein n=1 Tax=Micromonospora sp. CA-263727 TaxID=3239967 RepID=UPI003D8FA3F7